MKKSPLRIHWLKVLSKKKITKADVKKFKRAVKDYKAMNPAWKIA